MSISYYQYHGSVITKFYVDSYILWYLYLTTFVLFLQKYFNEQHKSSDIEQ